VKATSDMLVAVLSLEQFKFICEKFPDIYSDIRAIAEKREKENEEKKIENKVLDFSLNGEVSNIYKKEKENESMNNHPKITESQKLEEKSNSVIQSQLLGSKVQNEEEKEKVENTLFDEKSINSRLINPNLPPKPATMANPLFQSNIPGILSNINESQNVDLSNSVQSLIGLLNPDQKKESKSSKNEERMVSGTNSKKIPEDNQEMKQKEEDPKDIAFYQDEGENRSSVSSSMKHFKSYKTLRHSAIMLSKKSSATATTAEIGSNSCFKILWKYFKKTCFWV